MAYVWTFLHRITMGTIRFTEKPQAVETIDKEYIYTYVLYIFTWNRFP